MSIDKANSTKLVVSALIIAMLCTPMVAMVFAASEDGRTLSPEEDAAAVDEGPVLYASEGDLTAEDPPVLIQERDDNATDSSNPVTDDNIDGESMLISGQTAENNTYYFIAAAGGAVVVAVGAGIAVLKRRRH